MNLCNPALFYFILAVISILMLIVKKASATVIVAKIIGVILWTWVLNFVCTKGFTTMSWVLVLSPYVIMFVALMTGVVSMSDLEDIQKKQKPEDKKETLIIL